MNVNALIKQFLRDNKVYILSYCLFMAAYPISIVLLPKYYGQILESLKKGKKPKFAMALGLILLTAAMYAALDKLDNGFIPKLQAYIRVHVVKVVLESYKTHFKEQELGSMISKLIKLPMVVRELVRQIRNYLVPLCLIFVIVVIRFLFIDVRLGLFTLAALGTGVAVFPQMAGKCLAHSTKYDSQSDRSHESVSDIFDNLMDVYSMNTADEEISYLEKEQAELVGEYQETFQCANNLKTFLNVYGLVIFLVIIVYAYSLYKKKRIDLEALTNVAVTAKLIINKIGSFSGEAPDMVVNIGTYRRINSYIESLSLPEQKSRELFINKGDVRFENVGVRYGSRQVLEGFNLHVRPEESVAITGRVGSGKSSLLKSLLRFRDVDEGTITVEGVDISQVDPSSLRSQIMFVRQNPTPFNRSLYRNIAYGNDSITEERVRELFRKYDLSRLFGSHKLHDTIGRRGERLSGGQRTIVFLLRVLLSNKKVVVLDEPTSSLDQESASHVLRILRDIVKDRTVIIVTHDPTVLSFVDRSILVT